VNYTRSQQTFSEEGQTVNIFNFSDHMVLVTTYLIWLLKCEPSQRQYISKLVWLCSNKVLFTKTTYPWCPQAITSLISIFMGKFCLFLIAVTLYSDFFLLSINSRLFCLSVVRSFYCWVVFHFSILLIHFSVYRHLGCFQGFYYYEQNCTQHLRFNFLGVELMVGGTWLVESDY
jgi:hypothetical protein